ncbi:MAG: hypothetical protein ACKVQT_20480, partial [Burkholderiales bacterium]
DTSPSQAAVLLSFGNQISGGEAPMRARAAAFRRKGYVAAEPESTFPIPKLRGISVHISDQRDRPFRQRDRSFRRNVTAHFG